MKVSTINLKDLRSKKPADIEAYIKELGKTLSELRLAITTNKEKQTHQINVIKKSIARAKTILAEQVNQEKDQ